MYNRQQGQQLTSQQWQQLQQQQWQQQMQQMNQQQYANPYAQQGQPTGYVKKSGCGCGRRTPR